MNKNLFKIIFSLLLVFAVSDYIWYELLQDDSVTFELETEKTEEVKEEIREGNRLLDGKYDSIDGSSALYSSFQFLLKRLIGTDLNAYRYSTKVIQPLRLYIFHCQLRLSC
jgi:hypothetical protein